MAKIDAAQEKRDRNKIYAEKFKKDKKRKRPVAQYLNWCRTEGHPATCSCAYPSREEVIAASRR